MFKTGDIVRVTRVTEDDINFGRYVGEIGFFLGIDEEVPENMRGGDVIVQFPKFGTYYIYPDQIELVSNATLATIFYALNVNDDTLLKRITEFIETKR